VLTQFGAGFGGLCAYVTARTRQRQAATAGDRPAMPADFAEAPVNKT
jgi:hypothetical protein